MNYLRVQTDNLAQPFDINEGAKLDLGSTAKLRTLITYLEIVAELHARLAGVEAAELKAVAADGGRSADPLGGRPPGVDAGSQPAGDARGGDAPELLREPLGDLLHGRRRPSLRQLQSRAQRPEHERRRGLPALGQSRVRAADARHRAATSARSIRRFARDLLEDRAHPARAAYLARFADREGSTFLSKFYSELAGLGPDGALAQLVSEVRPRPERLAVIHRSVRPEADRATFAAFLQSHLPAVSEREADRLYDAYAIDRFSLADRAYIARVHPLKLWLASYLQDHPDATRAAVLEAGAGARQESYAWLFKTRHKSAQDRRIRILLEEDAFVRIHEAWRRLGYPFESLVPSYATAIGSSADRPEALAELIGIILNDGVWQPSVRVERLHFAAATPYETVLRRDPPSPSGSSPRRSPRSSVRA